MASPITLRAGRAGDLEALVRATLGNALESEDIHLDEATVRNGVEALLKDPHKGRIFVAEAEGTPLGAHVPGGVQLPPGKHIVGSCYVTLEWSDWHAAWYWWLQSVYVNPEWRGRHVYTELYRHIQDAARHAGNVRAIRLYVESHNTAALRAYRGHGMQQAPYDVFEWVVGPLP